MGKLFWKIFLVALPVLVVLGIVRKMLHLDDPSYAFLPDMDRLVEIMSHAPDYLVYDLINAFADAQNTITDMQTAFGNINDLFSFFAAIGSFFSVIGSIFAFVGQILLVPIKYFTWIFSVLLGTVEYA